MPSRNTGAGEGRHFLAPFGEFSNPRRVAELAVPAEQNGWHGLFVWDHARAVDPFVGGGTTMSVALEMGRRAEGVELNRGFCQHIVSILRAQAGQRGAGLPGWQPRGHWQAAAG